MNTLLLATSNPAKIDEIRWYLHDIPLKLVSLQDIGCAPDAPETGSTFKENALMKATYYRIKTGLPVLTDDGGIEIDALDGEPGVDSHRWISKDQDDADEDLISYLYMRMADIPLEKRGAQMRLVLCLQLVDGKSFYSEGIIRGIIAVKPTTLRTKGFPYRSVFYLPQIQKYYNHEELTKEESQKLNHRKSALDAMRPYLFDFVVNTSKI